jgi:hypothetical protein
MPTRLSQGRNDAPVKRFFVWIMILVAALPALAVSGAQQVNAKPEARQGIQGAQKHNSDKGPSTRQARLADVRAQADKLYKQGESQAAKWVGIDRDTPGYAEARRHFVIPMLKALKLLLDNNVPGADARPPLPGVNPFDIQPPGSPAYQAAVERHSRQMEARRTAELMDDLVSRRWVYTNNIAAYYAQPRHAPEELRRLASNILKNPTVVQDILRGPHLPHERQGPVQDTLSLSKTLTGMISDGSFTAEEQQTIAAELKEHPYYAIAVRIQPQHSQKPVHTMVFGAHPEGLAMLARSINGRQETERFSAELWSAPDSVVFVKSVELAIEALRRIRADLKSAKSRFPELASLDDEHLKGTGDGLLYSSALPVTPSKAPGASYQISVSIAAPYLHDAQPEPGRHIYLPKQKRVIIYWANAGESLQAYLRDTVNKEIQPLIVYEGQLGGQTVQDGE